MQTQIIPLNIINAPLSDLELLAKIRAKKLAEAGVLAEYKKANPIEFFSPNPPQLDFWVAYLNPQYRTFAYTGANRRGKTTIGCHLAIATMMGYIPYKLESINNQEIILRSWDSVYQIIKEWEGQTWELMYRNGIPLVKFIFKHDLPQQIRYVGQGWRTHVKEVVVPTLKKWWPKNRPVDIKREDGLEIYWTDKETEAYLRVMSNDQDASKFAGKDDDVDILDEPPKLDNYIELRRGLVDRKGILFIGATLLATEIWVHQKIIKSKLPDGTPDLRVYASDGEMSDNLNFGIQDQQDIDDFGDELLRLKPEDYDARIKGKPSYLAGIIFGIFTRPTHMRRRFPVPLDWIVDISIDTHPKECQAVLFLATSPRQEKFVVDEIWDHADPKSLAEMILRKIKLNLYRVENSWLIDPHSKGDSNNPETTYEKIEKVITSYKYSLEPASKEPGCLDDGIINVKDWLMTQNQAPALFFLDNCVRTILEIETWMWNPKTGKPMDKDDHMMENLRRLITLGTRWKPKKKKINKKVSVSWRTV